MEINSISSVQTGVDRVQSNSRAKRSASEVGEEEPEAKRGRACTLELSLYVRWNTVAGKNKMNHLTLRPVTGLDNLEGLSKDLMRKSFTETNRPEHLTSTDYYHFTPQEDCLHLPGDIASTLFKLVIHHEGWEYVVFERTLHNEQRDADRPLLVTVVEFESTAMMIGQLGIRITLVAYPMISVKKAFLDELGKRVQADPDFKGILS